MFLAFWPKQTVRNQNLDVRFRSEALVAENEALSPQLGQLQKKITFTIVKPAASYV